MSHGLLFFIKLQVEFCLRLEVEWMTKHHKHSYIHKELRNANFAVGICHIHKERSRKWLKKSFGIFWEWLKKSYKLWSLVFRSFGISWVLPRSVADTLLGWWNWPGKHLSSIWNLAPLCLMWCLWREWNRRTFEDMDSSDAQLLASFSGSLFDWSRTWGLTSSDFLPMFLSSLLYN